MIIIIIIQHKLADQRVRSTSLNIKTCNPTQNSTNLNGLGHPNIILS